MALHRSHFSVVAILVAAFLIGIPLYGQQPDRSGLRVASGDHSGILPRSILFAENIGQWRADTRLQGTAGDAVVRFTREGVSYFYAVDSLGADGVKLGTPGRSRGYLLETRFLGAATDLRIEGEAAADARFNYYLGPDEEDWHVGARSWERVRYRGLYPGIDALYYGSEGGLKYDFIVAPGASAETIALRYNGARALRITPKGELEVTTSFGAVREAPPYSYQEIGGRQVEVEASYRLLGGNDYGFTLGAYDPRYPVVIDPCLSVQYSTYFGGGNYDIVTAIAVDSTGNAYATGFTQSTDFQTMPDLGELEPANYIFVSKIAPDGSRLIYSTVIAEPYSGYYTPPVVDGLFAPVGEDIEVTRDGDAFVALSTNLSGLPTTSGVYKRDRSPNNLNSICGPRSFPNFDCYAVRLDELGRLLWGSYLGGSDDDYVTDIALDAQDFLHIAGTTFAPSCTRLGRKVGDRLAFPVTVTPGTFGTTDTLKGFESFLSMLTPDGTALRFSALYGGAGDDITGRIAADVPQSGQIYMIGSTTSRNLVTTANAYQQTPLPGFDSTTHDIYIARIDPNAGTLEYSSYFCDNNNGGRRGLGVGAYAADGRFPQLVGFDREYRRQALTIDRAGNVVFGGTTRSTTLPTIEGAMQSAPRNPNAVGDTALDCFVVRLDTRVNQLLASTYIGGSGYDAIGGVAVDSFDEIVVAYTTQSTDIPLSPVNIRDEIDGRADAAIATLNSNGQWLTYGTYIGGPQPQGRTFYHEESVYGLTIDHEGGLYLFGGTTSPNFPLVNALKRSNDYHSGYIVKFAPPGRPQLGGGTELVFNGEPFECQGDQIREVPIFNAGQLPLQVDSIRFMFRPGSFYLVNPPTFPFTLGACESRTIRVAFRPDASIECGRTLLDTMIVISSNSLRRELKVPIDAQKMCFNFGFFYTNIDDPLYILGSPETYDFRAGATGQVPQYITVTPDPANKGIFAPVTNYTNYFIGPGTLFISFHVTAKDTGYYCEAFNVTVQPCNRTYRLTLCSYVRSAIWKAPSEIDLGLVSCSEIDRPFHISNPGNDTLHFRALYIYGTTPGDIQLAPRADTLMHIPPGDSMEFTIQFRPTGIGPRESIILFQTGKGSEEGRSFPTIRVTAELDSVAFRLTSSDLEGDFGEIMKVPVNYTPLLEGRVPITELTFLVRYNERLLSFQSIDPEGSLTAGWEVREQAYIPGVGRLLKLRMRPGGTPIPPGTSSLLTSLRLKVLRGDTIASRLTVELSGVSAGCFTAELDSNTLFRLSPECAAYDRLLFSASELLKQSVPNPAADFARIPFYIPESGHVTLTVHDITGQEITRLLDETRPAGDQEIFFHTGTLAPGRYYYRLTIGKFIDETRAMVIER